MTNYKEKRKNCLIENIMSRFSNQYPVSNAYDYICTNRKYAGTLFQFMATSVRKIFHPTNATAKGIAKAKQDMAFSMSKHSLIL